MSIVVTGTNWHDVSQLQKVLASKVIMNSCNCIVAENLCADTDYTVDDAKSVIEPAWYVAHVRPRGEELAEKGRNPLCKPRHWIMEVSHTWFNRFRKLRVRHEKTPSSNVALTQFAVATIALRKIGVVYG